MNRSLVCMTSLWCLRTPANHLPMLFLLGCALIACVRRMRLNVRSLKVQIQCDTFDCLLISSLACVGLGSGPDPGHMLSGFVTPGGVPAATEVHSRLWPAPAVAGRRACSRPWMQSRQQPHPEETCVRHPRYFFALCAVI